MLKKGVIVLLVLLLPSLVYAGHVEWYAQTDCYEKSRPNIEHCQQQYDDLRLAHYDVCVSPSQGECTQFCEQFSPAQQGSCEKKCIDELPLAHFRYLDCLEGKENSYRGVYDYNENYEVVTPVPVQELPLEEPIAIEEPVEQPKAPVIQLSADRVASASSVEGDVWVIRKDGTREKIDTSYEFSEGDTIESAEGKAVLLLTDGHKIFVGKNTTIILGQNDKITLSFGAIRAFFKNLLIPFDIETKGGTLTVRGTEFILNHQKNISSLYLLEGEVEIMTNAGVETVSPGATINFDETGILSEEELTEAMWKSLTKEFALEEKVKYGSFIFFILVAVVIGLVIFFMARKKKVDKKRSRMSKLALSSLIFGIFSLLVGWLPFVGWVFILLTFVFGFRALKQIQVQKLSGRKLAIVAIVFGFISLVFAVIAFVIYIKTI